MRTEPQVIEVLNEILKAELTAVNQYFINSRLYSNWGLDHLASKAREESMEEMKHAEALIDRILFLEGEPNLSGIGTITTAKSVADQYRGDIHIEEEAIEVIRRGIELCLETADHGTRALLESILADEEGHLEWLGTQIALIEKVGEAQYLAQQLRPAGEVGAI